MKVFKYVLEGAESQEVFMPAGATILHVGADPDTGDPALWAKVDPSEIEESRHFEVVGTGWTRDIGDLAYIGTALCRQYVWHIFECQS